MKLSPLKAIIILVILSGIVYGTYSATMDQLPDLTGTVIGNTTSTTNVTNQALGSIYLHDENNNTSNMSIIITKNTKIYKEVNGKEVQTDMAHIFNNRKVDVYTIGDKTNTIPPQVTAERIVIKEK